MTTSVFDLDAFDRSVRPQDDLFRHVNGTWLRTARIPDDKASTGAFVELRDQAEQAVREIITGASADGEQAASAGEQSAETKIALLYRSFMDTERIETLGTEPVSYTHLRAHETSLHLVCRLLLEKKKIW